MRDDHLWAAVKITEAAVTQLFNGASTPNEVRRGQHIGEIIAELYTSVYAGIVEADYRIGNIVTEEAPTVDKATPPAREPAPEISITSAIPSEMPKATFVEPIEPHFDEPAPAPEPIKAEMDSVLSGAFSDNHFGIDEEEVSEDDNEPVVEYSRPGAKFIPSEYDMEETHEAPVPAPSTPTPAVTMGDIWERIGAPRGSSSRLFDN